MVNRVTKKSFMVSFREWASTATWLVEPLRGSSLLINLGRIKSRVDLGATLWFSTWDPLGI